jgi:membrane-bound serine protease (ClpP class)
LNVAGLLLLGLAVLLLFLEASVPSHGLLAIGGLICFVLGAGTFYSTPGPEGPNVAVAWPVVGVMAGFGLLFAMVVLRAAITSRRMRPANVSPGLAFSGRGTTGQIGEVRRTLDPSGSIYVAGEVWSARTAGDPVPVGGHVRVVGQDGLTLLVENAGIESPSGDAATAPAG